MQKTVNLSLTNEEAGVIVIKYNKSNTKKVEKNLLSKNLKLIASSQKTPKRRKESYAIKCSQPWAHSVSMLSLGIGVPLIRPFRMSPFFVYK